MIYIKRFIWALGYLPVFMIGLVLGIVQMISFPFIGLFYYIKNGDIETTPDKFLPIKNTIWLEEFYKKLEPKS